MDMKALGVFLVLLFVAPVFAVDCTTNSDCPSGQVCDLGSFTCVTQQGGAPSYPAQINGGTCDFSQFTGIIIVLVIIIIVLLFLLSKKAKK